MSELGTWLSEARGGLSSPFSTSSAIEDGVMLLVPHSYRKAMRRVGRPPQIAISGSRPPVLLNPVAPGADVHTSARYGPKLVLRGLVRDRDLGPRLGDYLTRVRGPLH